MSKSNSGHIIIRSDESDGIVTGSKASADMLVAQVAEKLQQHYPNSLWLVQMSPDQSVIGIRCMNANRQYGYILHTLDVQVDPELKCVVMAGGELLERGNLSRTNKIIKHQDRAEEFDISGAKFKKSSHNNKI